ncbi:oligosaccharide repeat unit polymerase [Marinicella litoralis]|uniref:Uncharacterized protein n=1 Tax=Marinicella litoralis TaxID=644220 RepID=A0A4R6Y0E6_9GAMM|nr:oligosaccharide repeat unit polymerase [Marinicella litoralis]TDR23583.1 hypothetical protein C8D91_0447 [Marinicella litoralis]
MKDMFLLIGLLLQLMLGFQSTAAEVPPELAQWQDWVKHDQAFRDCPYFSNQKSGIKNNHVCAWPQTLKFNVDSNQAAFSMTWEVLADSWIPLPGDQASWPQQVLLNQQPAAIQKHNQEPRLWLTVGLHQVSGQFSWQTRPEKINIPAELSDISLTLDGVSVKFPVRENNALWLGEAFNEQQVEANNLDIEVNRLIIDGHPMTLFMAIDLRVSGVARSENLGRIMLPYLQITDVAGDLNAYVDQQGELWVQLKPGYSEVRISMNVNGWPDELEFKADGEHWPKQEIWAYQDNKNIRLTQIEGVTAINPEQSSSLWNQVPNYLVNEGDTFKIIEQKRGTLNQSEQLSLNRRAWLSFSGDVYRTKDNITGGKFGSWRLNADDNHRLLSASSHNETLLITESDTGHQGVELRKPEIDLQVDGEFSKEFLSQISGWQVNFDSVRTELYLPHGYMALATHNVDHSRNVWIEKWRLWDIFVVMLLTVLSFKVIGIKSALAAFVTLVLGYHGLNMPLYAWANLIVAIAIIAWLPKGRWLGLFQVYALLSVLGLLSVLLPHWVTQARLMIHPQLERSLPSPSSFAPTPASSVKKAKDLSQVYTQAYNTQNAIQADMIEEQGKITVTGSRIKRADTLNRYQADAVLQAGKGTPEWQYNSVSLFWDGPITADQSYQLVLLSPAMRVVWRLLLILSSVYWLLALLQKMRVSFKSNKTTPKAALGSMLLLLFASPLLADNFPPEHLLEQLKNRMYQPSVCAPHCAAIESVQAQAVDQQLEMNLRYHVLDDVLVPLPDSPDWYLTSVKVNQLAVSSRLKFQDKHWLSLQAGIHDVLITGVLANRNSISVRFPLKPGQVKVQSENWQFAGLDGQQLSSDTLQLIATIQAESNEQANATDIKPFVKVKRSLTFDDQWYIQTQVSRVAPQQGVINVTVPLVNQEFPTEKVQLDDHGAVMVSMGPNQFEFYWRSRLERVPHLQLIASESEQYIETWEVITSPQWHVNIAGVPLVASENMVDDADDYFVHVYMPRPGETLELDITRPKAVAGDVLSIDSSSNVYTLGKRTTKVETNIRYRATQGGHFDINLDPEAQVKKVTFDGIESNLINEDGVVAVSYLPGAHRVSIEWHVNQELGSLHHTPSINLNSHFSNLSQTIQVPRDRWLLWGHSAGVGPAFLYWGELLVFAVLAFFLARIKYSPLKFWQWLVLGCAFGTFSWLAFSVVASWLFFVGWKQDFNGFDSRAKRILLQWFSVFFTIGTIGVLIATVAYGLLSYPDMGVAGQNASSSTLYWYLDSGLDVLPNITLLSVHLWWYKLLILLWSIWISFAVINWLKCLFLSLNKEDWWPKFNRKKQAAKEVETK